MSTGETTAELPTPPDWDQTPEEFSQEFKQQWMQTHLAHQGMMLDKIQRQQAIVEATARFAATGDSAQLAKEITPQGVEDAEMGVSIGNKEYHVHNYPSSPVTNTTTTTTEASPVAKASSTLAKAAAAAALVGAGGIGVVGVNMAIDALTRPDPSPVIVQPATDTDTNAGLRFKD